MVPATKWEDSSPGLPLRMVSLKIKTSHRKRFPLLLLLPLGVLFSKAWVCDRQQGTIWGHPSGWQSWKNEIMGLRYGIKSQILPMWSCSTATFRFLLIEIIHIFYGLIHFMSDFPVACSWKYHSEYTQNSILIMFPRNVTPVTAYPCNIWSFITWLFTIWEPGCSLSSSPKSLCLTLFGVISLQRLLV